MATDKIGNLKNIGGFELQVKIGAGGMGTVFKARQVSLDRIVALKILPPSVAKDQKFIERFMREARTSAKLNHENIVQGIDVGKDEASGLYYFAMEIVDGPSLKGVLEKEKVIPERRALQITREVSAALECAEKAGIVHRDIKPDNILLTSNGKVKLADLGLARQTGANDAGITLGGTALGTPYYMSPEQVRGELDKVSVRSDIYSLGATLFNLVTGRHPFTGATSALIMSKHLTEAPPKPREINPEISEDCSRLILKMLQKDAAKRQQSAAELSAEIDRILSGEPAQPPAPRQRTGKHEPTVGRATTGRHRPVGEQATTSSTRQKKNNNNGLLIGGGAVVVLGVIGFVVLGKNGRPEPQPQKPVVTAPTNNTPAASTATDSKAAEPSAETVRATKAAEALDNALKADAADAFDKVMKLSAVESAVHGTPSEAAWKKAFDEFKQAVEKLLAAPTDYPALLVLKDKCAQPPLAALFDKACKDAEAKAMTAWNSIQQDADKKAGAGEFGAARELANPFSKSPVSVVADAAHKELDRITLLEKEKAERDQKEAAAAKSQDEKLRYDLYQALLKSTESLDLLAAGNTLKAWRAKPEAKDLSAEMNAIATEFKWLEDQGTRACQEMAAKNATVDVLLGKVPEKRKVIQAEPTGISVSLGDAQATVSVAHIAIPEIITYCGWNQPGKDSALSAARYEFWRKLPQDARKRVETPANDDERKMLERIDMVLIGAEKFYKPDTPKNFAAAVPKEMIVGGKALDGAKDIAVLLTWDAGSLNSRKYRVERKIDTGDFQAVSELSEKKFCDDKQPLDTQLEYRVVALNAAGESAATQNIQVKTPPPKIVNLLPNGDFESGTAKDWGPQDNVKSLSITSEGTHGGKGALLFRGSGGTDRSVDVKDGRKYEVTGWVKLVPHGDPVGGDVYCFIRTIDYNELSHSPVFYVGGNGPGGTERKKITANEWTKFQYTFTAKGNQIRFRMHKFHDDNCDAMFDDFVLSEAP